MNIKLRAMLIASYVKIGYAWKSPLNLEETFDTYTEEEADELGLEEGFAEDQIWDW